MLLLRWLSFEGAGHMSDANPNYAPGQREMEDTQGWPKVCWYYVKETQVCLGRRGHDSNKHEPYVFNVDKISWISGKSTTGLVDTKSRCRSESNMQIRCSLLAGHKEEHRASVSWMNLPHRPLIDRAEVESTFFWSASRLALSMILRRASAKGNFGYNYRERLGLIERMAKAALKEEKEDEEQEETV